MARQQEDGGFGFYLDEAKEGAIVVSHASGGAKGLVHPGMRVLEVNGESTKGKAAKQLLVDMDRVALEEVYLTVTPSGGEAYALRHRVLGRRGGRSEQRVRQSVGVRIAFWRSRLWRCCKPDAGGQRMVPRPHQPR